MLETRRKFKMPRRLDLAASMDHADRNVCFAGREARQVGLLANGGEGALVDRGAVADVVVADHSAGSGWMASAASAASGSGNITSGVSLARPSRTSATPASVPTSTRLAGVGWAQPLAQPEMWTEPGRLRRAASFRASSRVAI